MKIEQAMEVLRRRRLKWHEDKQQMDGVPRSQFRDYKSKKHTKQDLARIRRYHARMRILANAMKALLKEQGISIEEFCGEL
jgi:hypothetical protein